VTTMQPPTVPPDQYRVRVRKRRRRRKRRHPVRRGILLLLLLLLVAAAVSVWTALPAVAASRDARTRIAAIQAVVGSTRPAADAAGMAALDTHVVRLMDDLRVIEGTWSFWHGPALFVSAVDPRVHAQVAQVDPLLRYGRLVAEAGHILAARASPLLSSLQNGEGSLAGPALVASLNRARPALLAAAPVLEQAARARGQIVPADLPSPLRSSVAGGLRRLDAVLPDAPATLHALSTLPAALGAVGPRDYLLVPQNSEDLRASGGFIGTVGLLHVDQGKARFVDGQNSYDVDQFHGRRPDAYPPLPLMTHNFGAWYFRDANWSADFPTTARLLEIFYGLGMHRHVDGVIAFDPALLPSLLTLTGPIPVPGYPETLTPANAFARIDYYVNIKQAAPGTNSKDFAIAAYRAVFDRLLALPHTAGLRALTTMTERARARDLLLYADDPAVERTIRLAGADGALNPTRDDYLYVVDTNTSYNKLNQLIEEKIWYRATIQPDRSILATTTISYTNTADATNLPRPNGEPFYGDFVRVFAPAGSQLVSTGGLDESWKVYTLHNKTQFSGYLALGSHESRTIAFTYHIPANADTDGAYRLTVQKQPGTAPIPLDIAVSATPGVTLGGAPRHVTTLTHDVVVTSPLSGGTPRPARLTYHPDPPVVPGSRPEPWVSVPARSVAVNP